MARVRGQPARERVGLLPHVGSTADGLHSDCQAIPDRLSLCRPAGRDRRRMEPDYRAEPATMARTVWRGLRSSAASPNTFIAVLAGADSKFVKVFSSWAMTDQAESPMMRNRAP